MLMLICPVKTVPGDVSAICHPSMASSGWHTRPGPPPPLAGINQFSDNHTAGQHSTSVKYGLYPGSALSRFRSSNLLSPSTFESKVPLESSLVHPYGRSIVDWRQLMGDRDSSKNIDRETSLSDDMSTQAVDTPIHHFSVLDPASSPPHVDFPSPNSVPRSSLSPRTTPLVCSTLGFPLPISC